MVQSSCWSCIPVELDRKLIYSSTTKQKYLCLQNMACFYLWSRLFCCHSAGVCFSSYLPPLFKERKNVIFIYKLDEHQFNAVGCWCAVTYPFHFKLFSSNRAAFLETNFSAVIPINFIGLNLLLLVPVLVKVVPNSMLHGESPLTKSIAHCQFKGKGDNSSKLSKIYCNRHQYSF